MHQAFKRAVGDEARLAERGDDRSKAAERVLHELTTLGLPALVANMLGIAAAMAWNFTLSLRWTFSPSLRLATSP